MCIIKKYIQHDCQPILMLLCITLTYLMLFTALFNAVCLHYACYLFVYFAFEICIVISYTNDFVFLLCLWVIDTYISIIILHHVQCFYSVVFLNFMFTLFLFMKGLCALRRNSTKIANIISNINSDIIASIIYINNINDNNTTTNNENNNSNSYNINNNTLVQGFHVQFFAQLCNTNFNIFPMVFFISIVYEIFA